jgi:16S rRNA pseudouridine516 synthase
LLVLRTVGIDFSVCMNNKMTIKPISLEKILFSQGFGTRRHCRNLVFAELVKINGQLMDDPDILLPTQELFLEVDGQVWQYHEKAYVVFHKPANYECSHKTKHHPSVYSLLPPQLIERGIQCVGRLDQDTTGLLLLSDDGQFIHQMTTPKKNIGKNYLIHTAQEIEDHQIEKLLQGVVLDDDPAPCFATHCRQIDNKTLEMTIVEGRYHQVKRMLAAVGNHVVKLHRTSIGSYGLPKELLEGHWQWLNEENIAALYQRQEHHE